MSRGFGDNDSLDTYQKKKMQLGLKIYPMTTAKFRSIDMSDKCQMSRAQPRFIRFLFLVEFAAVKARASPQVQGNYCLQKVTEG